MLLHVALQRALDGGAVGAEGAGVGPVACVHAVVLGEIVLVVEDLPTARTGNAAVADEGLGRPGEEVPQLLPVLQDTNGLSQSSPAERLS